MLQPINSAKWCIRNVDESDVINVADKLQLPLLTARALVGRGFQDVHLAEWFMKPEWEHLPDPMLLPDAQKAVDRLKLAIERKEKILVHGDYDVDGITATALWVDSLSKLKADVVPRIPHRKKDGYGIKVGTVKEAASRNVKLILTCDCGIHAHDVVEAARLAGIDVIITDHHEPGSELPKAVAVVNPHISGSLYPFIHLSGVGVTYRLCEALVASLGYPVQNFRERYLDLVTLGTVADVMPLVGDNRIICHHGLGAICNSKRPGIKALLKAAHLDVPERGVCVRNVQFALAPRINAVGRMADAQLALDLMITGSEERAQRLAAKLESCNNERRAEQEKVMEQALAIVEAEYSEQDRVLALHNEDWDSGIIGIVAGKLLDRYGRPTIMMTREAGSTYWRGSARSLGGFDIIEAFRQHGHLFVEFGGHTQAAGFSIMEENIPLLRQQLNEYAARMVPLAEMVPELYYDGIAEGSDIGAELLGSLEQMEPCGEGNPETLFMMANVTLVDSRNLGLENQHWKFRVSSSGQQHECIGFYLGDQSGQFEVGDQLDILFHPEWNHFNGEARIQMRIRDVRRCAN